MKLCEGDLCSWRCATQSGCARCATESQHIFPCQQLYAFFRNRQRECNWSRCDSMSQRGSPLQSRDGLAIGRMNHDCMLDHGIDRCHQSSTRTRPARTMRRNMRIINSRMGNDFLAMQSAQKTQQVQTGEDGAEEQLVRDVFLSIHKRS